MNSDRHDPERDRFPRDEPGGIGEELETAPPPEPSGSSGDSSRPATAGRGDGRARATFLLKNRQIVFLDRLSADIRARSGTIVKRADVVRALIDHLADQPLDLSSVQSVADLRRRIREIGAPAKLRGTPPGNGAPPSPAKEKEKT